MSKKVNPNLYRSALYKYSQTIFTPYSLFNYTEIFIQSLQVYNYLLNILCKSLLVSIFYHPFFMDKRLSYKKYIKKRFNQKFRVLKLRKIKKKNKRRNFKHYLVLTFKTFRNYEEIIKAPIWLKKKRLNLLFKKIFVLSKVKTFKFFKLLKVPFLLTKTKQIKKSKSIPFMFPIKQEKRKKIKYFKRSGDRFFISDIYLLYQNNVVNIFISYDTSAVFYHNLFLFYYKRLILLKNVQYELKHFLLYKSNVIKKLTESKLMVNQLKLRLPGIPNKLIKLNDWPEGRKKRIETILESFSNIEYLKAGLLNKIMNEFLNTSLIKILNSDFLWFLKTNIQFVLKKNVNLFFFKNTDIEVFSYLAMPNNSSENSKKMSPFFDTTFVEMFGDYFRFKRILHNKMQLKKLLVLIQSALITGSSSLLVQIIIFQLRRTHNVFGFLSYLKRILHLFFRGYNLPPLQYLVGYKIIVAGRLSKKPRRKKFIIKKGPIGLIKKTKRLDFHKSYVITKHGVLSVRVYLFFN